jgi:hypothetical protein
LTVTGLPPSSQNSVNERFSQSGSLVLGWSRAWFHSTQQRSIVLRTLQRSGRRPRALTVRGAEPAAAEDEEDGLVENGVDGIEATLAALATLVCVAVRGCASAFPAPQKQAGMVGSAVQFQ